jgi:hypothetical protein
MTWGPGLAGEFGEAQLNLWKDPDLHTILSMSNRFAPYLSTVHVKTKYENIAFAKHVRNRH